mgnify:CR=1 FL=1
MMRAIPKKLLIHDAVLKREKKKLKTTQKRLR